MVMSVIIIVCIITFEIMKMFQNNVIKNKTMHKNDSNSEKRLKRLKDHFNICNLCFFYHTRIYTI